MQRTTKCAARALPIYHPSCQASHPRVQLVRLATMLRGGRGGKGGGRRRTALALNASFTPCATLHLLALHLLALHLLALHLHLLALHLHLLALYPPWI